MSELSIISMADYLRGDRSNRRRAECWNGHPDLHVCVRSQWQHRGDAAAQERGQVGKQGIRNDPR